jgi:DNA polymerase III alpha subunit
MTYTSYSFRNALGMPADIVPLLKEHGHTYAPIADIASTFGHHSWMKACETHGLKPVFGVSLYVTPAPAAKKPILDLWQFYAIENVKSVYDLVTLAFQQGRSLPRLGFTPMLRYDQIEGLTDLIKIAGHKARLEQMTPHENLYVGLSAASAKGFIRRAIDGGFDLMASQINRFARPEDEHAWELACGFNANVQTHPQWFLDRNEWGKSVGRCFDNDSVILELLAAEKNVDKAFSKCTATLNKGSMIEPERPDTLRNLCIAGAAKLGIDLTDAKYSERLDHELSVIEKKGFSDYFYLASDFLSWARKNMSVGPGRGSSAGSLVCYLLEITFVDPLKYDLLFSRFLDESRPDWPDVDSDVSDRDRAIEYLETKYGKERVAKLGTLAMWQAKNTTNEVTKALAIPRFEADVVLNAIPDFAAGDSRKDTALAVALDTTNEGQRFVEKHPGFEHVKKIVGTPSHAATHASAVVLTQEPLSNFVGVDPVNGRTMCDMHEAEALGLLKLDVLGLSTLSIIEETLKLAGLPNDYMNTVDLNDQKAFDVLNDGKFLGVFQFEGYALRRLTKTIRVTTFDDLSILSALSRPGAAEGADAWVRRRSGVEKVTYPHELLEPYLKETLGAIAFQETIMKIAHDLGGLDWPTVAKLRKAIGKSQGEAALDVYGQPFKDGLVKSGIPEEIAIDFWRMILASGSYLFNKSHTVAYGMISYWTCWLKAYYPVEFATAALAMKSDTESQLEYLRELDKEGIGYLPFDIELSTEKWRVAHKNGEKVIVAPLSIVRGLGPKRVSQILSCRARNEPLPEALQKLLKDPKTEIDSLTPIATAIEKLDISKALRPDTKVTSLKDVTPNNEWQDGVIVMGVAEVIKERSENEPERQQSRKERGQAEVYKGPDKYLEIRLKDDTESNFLCKIGAKDFAQLSPKVLDGKPGKSVYAMKITVTPEIKMGLVKGVNYVGEI